MSDTPPITPVLACADIEAAHDFLVSAFGFEPGSIDRDGAGHVVHGEVHLRGQSIWLHRGTTEHGLDSPQSHDLSHGGLAVLVADVDDHCAGAQEAGAVIDHEPQDQPYGRREYGARDPGGTSLVVRHPIGLIKRSQGPTS